MHTCKSLFRVLGVCGLVVSALLLIMGTALGRQQQALADKLIRLHVVAETNSCRDQAIKLQVRDAVLAEVQDMHAQLLESDNPKAVLFENLEKIRAVAEKCLREAGCDAPVGVCLGKELFPTREYETFSLPAGVYTALRVNIGRAEGQNWWCVVFPNLCMSASMDEFAQSAAAVGLNKEEVRLITEDSVEYELKFKTLELLKKLRQVVQETKRCKS